MLAKARNTYELIRVLKVVAIGTAAGIVLLCAAPGLHAIAGKTTAFNVNIAVGFTVALTGVAAAALVLGRRKDHTIRELQESESRLAKELQELKSGETALDDAG